MRKSLNAQDSVETLRIFCGLVTERVLPSEI